eukprot:TRINITY_DN106514_c0_g1_i1.p1 TRINITY_DN106514_c0_g1~~TRINITY_DN106514_c0_g1_i1.p1  ORF type:complete len:307 (-),score=41.30 TRINITY_DN106514_c0_g1_i1:70-990(-)
MGAGESKPGLVVQALLYSPGPFFCYPWKPFLNHMYGGDYLKSYKHFRMQHTDTLNLILHCFCLVWQISSNYALLHQLDKTILPFLKHIPVAFKELVGEHPVTRLTTALWALTLVRTSPTPGVVKLASLASLWAAHTTLGDLFRDKVSELVYAQGIVEAMVVQRLLLQRNSTIGLPGAVFLVLRTALCKFLCTHQGVFRESKLEWFFMALVVSASLSKKPLERTVVTGWLGWIVALLTDNKSAYLWSCSFMASLGQGVSHRISGELGTLEVLQNDLAEQTSYELSHVTFFPNLLFQAVHAQLQASRK